MNFRGPTGRYKLFATLLGLAAGHMLRAGDSAMPSMVGVNLPGPAYSPQQSENVQTVALLAPAPPKPAPLSAEAAMPSAMVFHEVPVGIVAQIIGVRLGQKVEVETSSRYLISGDFGHMNLIQALNEAAAKANLVVIDEGPEGLHLVSRYSSLVKTKSDSMISVLPVAAAPTGKSAAELAAEEQHAAALKAADEKRIELLKLRAKLLLQEPEQ
jgi:hypothetical protein